jgi:hypothetical protein
MRFLKSLVLTAVVCGAALGDDPPKKAIPLTPATPKASSKLAEAVDGPVDEQIEKLKAAEKAYDKATREAAAKRIEISTICGAILKGDSKSEAYIPAFLAMMKVSPIPTTQINSYVAKILDNHSASPKLAEVLPFVARQQNAETILAKIAEKSTDKSVKGIATFMMAEMAAAKIDREKDLDMRQKLQKSTVEMFDTVQKEFGDVVFRDEKLSTLSESASYSARYLQVGMTVPEVEGPDMDGKKFKISDYRGKVVLLDFWGHW